MKHLMHSASRRAAPPGTGRLVAFLLLGLCWPLTVAGLQSGDLLGGVVDPAGERLEGVFLVLEEALVDRVLFKLAGNLV